MDALNEALISIRRILRATEIHGKALRAAADLKTSQLMVLQTLEDEPELTVGQITERVRMAQASVTAIVARLEQMDLVRRERGTTDKRKVFVNLTDAGHDILEQAPEALHRRFAEQFEPLEAWEKTMIVAALRMAVLSWLMKSSQIVALRAGGTKSAHAAGPLERHHDSLEPRQKVKRQRNAANRKNSEHYQGLRPPVDKNHMQQGRHQMVNNQNGQIGRPVVSTLRTEVLAAHRTGVAHFEIALEQRAIATLRAFSSPAFEHS